MPRVSRRPTAAGRPCSGQRRPTPRSAQAACGPMLDDARAACAALGSEDEGVEACTAQLALGMALVFCGAGDEGPRAIRSAIAMAGYRRNFSPARRSPGAGRSRRRSSCARRARRGSRSGARSSLRAIAASPAPSARCSSCWRATRPRPIAGPRLAPATTRPPSWREQTGQPSEECAALSGLAWLEAREGREETCRAHAAAALEQARQFGRGFNEAWALAALGDLELALGRPAEAVDRLTRHERGARAPRHRRRRPLARARARRGARPVRSRRGCHRRVRRATGGARPPRASRGRWRARRARRDSWRTTARSRSGSTRRCAGTTRRPTRSSAPGASWPTASACAALAGGATRAPHLRAAFAAFHQLGAEPWAERARLELAATGETARKRDPSTLDQLTPRELQIALDLAAGLTTREAAAKLYPQPEDDRVPPAQRVPQARRRLARRARRGLRAIPRISTQRLLHSWV